jgi:hypothetical protein
MIVASFATEEDILGVTRAARADGLKIVDVYAPYAVHGLDTAMGMKRSRLAWVCFAAGMVGAILKLWFEFWTAGVDWPVNVGGKPWNSLPAYVPVTFEVMVLSAGLVTVFVFLVISKLKPGKSPVLLAEGITNDTFVLAIEQEDATFDLERVRKLLERFNVRSISERYGEEVS